MEDVRRQRWWWTAFGTIVLAAFLLRLWWGSTFPVLRIQGDSLNYDRRAREILQGVYGSPMPSAQPPPLYPWVMSLVYRWSDSPLPALLSLQALLDTISVALGGLIAMRRLGRTVGIVTTAAMALNPAYIGMAGLPMTETLFLVCFMAFAACLFCGREAAGRWRLVAAGIFCGLAVLTREVMLWFPLFVLLIQLAARRNVSGIGNRAWLWVLLGEALVVLPWTIRNAIALHAFVPVSTNIGENLYYGNSPKMIEWEPVRPYQELGEVEQYRLLTRDAVAYILSHPLAFIGRGFIKLWRIFRPEPYPLSWGMMMTDVLGSRHFFAIWTGSLLYWFTVFAAGLAGIWRKRARPAEPLLRVMLLFLLFILLVHIVSFGHPRFRFPLEFVFILFAAIFFTAKRD